MHIDRGINLTNQEYPLPQYNNGICLKNSDRNQLTSEEKMIDDLTIFFNKLIAGNHEVILLINANEPLPPGSGISRLLKNTNMVDLINLRHGFRNIPNTHQSDSQQIDYCFCTYLINNFIKLCAINPFNFFSSADHRGGYIDVQLKIFLL